MATATNAALGTVKMAGDIQAGDALNPALVPSGVIPGEYPTIYKIHVDSKGRTVWVGGEPEEVKEDVPMATYSVVGSVKPGKNITFSNNTISVNKCSTTTLGVAKLGAGLDQNGITGATDVVLPDASTTVYGKAKGNQEAIVVDGSGFIKVDPNGYCTEIGPATTSSIGFIKTGAGLNISSGEYLDAVVWPARTDVYGGIKLGEGFTLDDGFLETFKATNSLPGVVMNSNNMFYIDPQGAIYLHTTHYGLYGYLQGISGNNLYLDNSTHTLSATWSFTDFTEVASSTVFGKVQIGDNINVSPSGVIKVWQADEAGQKGVIKVSGRIFKVINGALTCDYSYPASATYYGGVKPDNVTITIDANSAISFDSQSSALHATPSVKGLLQVGENLSVTSGTISIPTATDTIPGLVRIGSGITSSANGLISVTPPQLASELVTGIVRLSENIANNFTDYDIVAVNKASTVNLGGILASNNYPLQFSWYTGAGLQTSCYKIHYAFGLSSTIQLGYVKVQNGIFDVGTASATSPGLIKLPQDESLNYYNEKLNLKLASVSDFGVVNVGTGFVFNNGAVCYIPPPPPGVATTTQWGTIKINNQFTVDTDGLLSVLPQTGFINPSENNKLKGQVSKVNYSFIGSTISVSSKVFTLAPGNYEKIINIFPAGATVNNCTISIVGAESDSYTTGIVASHDNPDLKFAYKAIWMGGTTDVVRIRFHSINMGYTDYYGNGLTPGDIILFTFKQVNCSGSNTSESKRLFLKSAEIFKN